MCADPRQSVQSLLGSFLLVVRQHTSFLSLGISWFWELVVACNLHTENRRGSRRRASPAPAPGRDNIPLASSFSYCQLCVSSNMDPISDEALSSSELLVAVYMVVLGMVTRAPLRPHSNFQGSTSSLLNMPNKPVCISCEREPFCASHFLSHSAMRRQRSIFLLVGIQRPSRLLSRTLLARNPQLYSFSFLGHNDNKP